MNTAQDTIVQLNEYPPDKFNVLIPVTSMQVMSNMQKIIVNKVELDTNPETSKDIYKEKTSGKFAITAVGGTKLAAAANISIIPEKSGSLKPEVCTKCIEMAKAVGKAPSCGSCAHAYDTTYMVTIRVPEPSGGFRTITKTKEIDCSIEKQGMTEAQYKRFLTHRAAIAETKAYMRCIRAALGLAAGYTLQELKKPFVIAHIVPNLDAPEMRQALINNSIRDMGLLFERPTAQEALETREPLGLPMDGSPIPTEDEYPDNEEPMSAADYIEGEDGQGELPWMTEEEPQGITCADCGREITATTGTNGQTWTPEAIKGFSEKRFGRCLCPDCQKKQPKANTRR